MCHLDCVKTVQSGEMVVVKGWIWYQLYIQYVNLNETVDILTEKRNTFVSTTCLQKYKVFFKNGLPCFQTVFISRVDQMKKVYLKTIRFNILNIQIYSVQLTNMDKNCHKGETPLKEEGLSVLALKYK